MKAHLVVLAACLVPGLCDNGYQLQELRLNNGLDRGVWGPTDICSDRSWTTAFEVKYETEGHMDNTGMNAVRLICQDAAGGLTGEVTSKEGQYGNWQGLRSCPSRAYLVGMRGDVMPYQGTFGDDEGLTNFEMKCSDGTILTGVHSINSKRGENGEQIMDDSQIIISEEEYHQKSIHVKLTQYVTVKEWGNWAECSVGKRICGIDTQVETGSVSDDAGLSNLIMYCCDA